MIPTTQCHPVRTAFSDGQYPAPLFRIEKNIRQVGKDPETGFALDECLYALEATVRPDTRHVMYSTGILQMVADTVPAIDYSMEISSYYKYRNDTQ